MAQRNEIREDVKNILLTGLFSSIIGLSNCKSKWRFSKSLSYCYSEQYCFKIMYLKIWASEEVRKLAFPRMFILLLIGTICLFINQFI